MKAFTDINQSKKLAEILPLECADMYWKNGVSDKYIQCFTPFVIDEDATNVNFDYDVPCWSLTALLNVLPSATLDSSDDHHYRLHCMERYTEWYDNPIDACVAMIERLHEQKLL